MDNDAVYRVLDECARKHERKDEWQPPTLHALSSRLGGISCEVMDIPNIYWNSPIAWIDRFNYHIEAFDEMMNRARTERSSPWWAMAIHYCGHGVNMSNDEFRAWRESVMALGFPQPTVEDHPHALQAKVMLAVDKHGHAYGIRRIRGVAAQPHEPSNIQGPTLDALRRLVNELR